VTDAIDGYADEDPEFGQLVDESALDDGPPNRNLDRIYGELRDSGYADFTGGEYLADDSRSTRVVYDVESDASDAAITADAREVADRYRGDATATGQIVVFQAVSETIFSSAIVSLSAALGLSALLIDRPLVPRKPRARARHAPARGRHRRDTHRDDAAGRIPFNALTATIPPSPSGSGSTTRFTSLTASTTSTSNSATPTPRSRPPSEEPAVRSPVRWRPPRSARACSCSQSPRSSASSAS